MYSTEEENQEFFQQMAHRFKGAEIQFDLFNHWMSSNTALQEGVSKTAAEFKFGLDDEQEITTWHQDLQYEATWLLGDFPNWHRLGFVFVSWYLLSPMVRDAVKFLKFSIKK